jgi:hypothetical protein
MRESQTHSLSFSSADRLTDRLTDVGLTDNNRITESRLLSLVKTLVFPYHTGLQVLKQKKKKKNFVKI